MWRADSELASPAVSPASAHQTVSRPQPANGVCPGKVEPSPRRSPAGWTQDRVPARPSPAGSFPQAASRCWRTLTAGGLSETNTENQIG